MIPFEYRIPYKYGESFRLKPLGDIHLGNTYCDVAALKEYLSDSDEHTRILGLGDMIDAVVTKDIKRYMKHSDGTKRDDVVDEQVDWMYEILAPYKELIIGLMDGNHEHTIVKYHGSNPNRRLCEKLGCQHLGYSCLGNLRFRENEGRARTVTIRAHHGWGGGSRTLGADLTKYSKDMAYYDADIFIYGHVHRRQSDTFPRLSLSGTRLIAKPRHLFICGTFLKTLSLTTDATYSEISGYPPTAIGGVNITIKPDNNWVKIESDV